MTAVFKIAKNWSQPQCSLTGELIRKYYIAMTFEWSTATCNSIDESHEYNVEQISKL